MAPKSSYGSKQPKAILDIAREEWDFESWNDPAYSGCPDDELSACYEYEFSREALRLLPVSSKRHFLTTIAKDRFTKSFYQIFEKQFPAIPWLKVLPSLRNRWKEAKIKLQPPRAGFHAVSADHFNRLRNGDERGECFRPGANFVHQIVVPVAIEWQFTDDRIATDFRAWLQQNRPPRNAECKLEIAGSNSHTQIRTALRHLGAYRLQLQMSFPAAVEFTIEQRGRNDAGLYKAKDWYLKSGVAKRIIEAWTTPVESLFSTHKTLVSHLRSLRKARHRFKSLSNSTQLIFTRMDAMAVREMLALSEKKVINRISPVHEFPGPGDI